MPALEGAAIAHLARIPALARLLAAALAGALFFVAAALALQAAAPN